mmetsp:Transcript_24099/g.34496  ORF Transcript_24099/g.34496 Transcript_24099/m.34496 type:complete len:103 (-) Transcript_24099:2246-2554(-)
MMDLNALNIANKWFASTNSGFNELRESVFQARFLHRMPYAVESSTDPITPPLHRLAAGVRPSVLQGGSSTSCHCVYVEVCEGVVSVCVCVFEEGGQSVCWLG